MTPNEILVVSGGAVAMLALAKISIETHRTTRRETAADEMVTRLIDADSARARQVRLQEDEARPFDLPAILTMHSAQEEIRGTSLYPTTCRLCGDMDRPNPICPECSGFGSPATAQLYRRMKELHILPLAAERPSWTPPAADRESAIERRRRG